MRALVTLTLLASTACGFYKPDPLDDLEPMYVASKCSYDPSFRKEEAELYTRCINSGDKTYWMMKTCEDAGKEIYCKRESVVVLRYAGSIPCSSVPAASYWHARCDQLRVAPQAGGSAN